MNAPHWTVKAFGAPWFWAMPRRLRVAAFAVALALELCALRVAYWLRGW